MKRIFTLSCFMFIAALAINAQTTYYSEDFEGGLPMGWTAEDQWMHGNNASLSSAYLAYNGNETSFMAFNDDAAGGAHVGGGSLISSSIDLTAVSGPLFLELNVFFSDADYQGANETFSVSASIDGGTSWEVLEDFGALNWSRLFYSVDQFAGQMVLLSFNYDDGVQWNFGCAIDDIGISDELILTPSKDYVFTINGGSQFAQCAADIDYNVEGLVINNAYVPITSFDVVVTDASGTPTTHSFDNVMIEQYQAMPYTLPESINTGSALQTYSVAIANVNGDMDEDAITVDNSATLVLNPQMGLNAEQAVVVEEATGTWCTWCPRGTVYLDEMSKRFPDNFIGIAVHNGDPMVLAEYDTGVTSFPGFQGFPSVIYNRESVLNPDAIVTPTINDASQAPVATIELGAEESGNSLSTSVKVTFQQAVTANHNVVVVLTEDGLTGPAADGWNQVSGAYSGGGNGPMGGFEYLPTSVPSEWWPYDHVGRALIGGYGGVNEVIGDYEVGSSPSVYLPDFDVSADWNKDNMHIVAILLDASGQVVNAVSGKYNDAILTGLVTSNEEILSQDFASVYPNPVDDMATINMSLETASQVTVSLLDNLGRTVSTKRFGEISGKNQLSYDVSTVNPGVYMMNIRVDDKLVTKKITIL